MAGRCSFPPSTRPAQVALPSSGPSSCRVPELNPFGKSVQPAQLGFMPDSNMLRNDWGPDQQAFFESWGLDVYDVDFATDQAPSALDAGCVLRCAPVDAGTRRGRLMMRHGAAPRQLAQERAVAQRSININQHQSTASRVTNTLHPPGCQRVHQQFTAITAQEPASISSEPTWPSKA